MIEPAQGYIPRSIAKWLDTLDLAYQVRNLRRDLANGFIVAEILSRYYPKEISIYTFDNGLNLDKRRDNWEQIAKLLSKKEFSLKQTEFEPVYHQAPDAAQRVLFRLYEFLTKKKIDQIIPDSKEKGKDNKPQMTTLLRSKPELPKPSYAKPTASHLAKDREIVRIVDIDLRKTKTQNAIVNHDEQQRQDKQDDNIIEYLILKRKRQIEEEIKKQEEELIKKQMRFNKKIVNLDQSQQSQNAADIKEIQLNCYHSSTSKNEKEQQGKLMETKGVIDFLHEQCANLFKKDPILKDIKDLKLEPKESQQNNGYQANQANITYTNVIQQLFFRCDEVQKKSLKLLLNNYIDYNIQVIIENVNNNFIDFKRFFQMFLRPIEILKPTSKTYILILELIRNVGNRLLELEPQGTQMMFESILLNDLLQIALKYPNKREELISLFYIFTQQSSLSRLHLLHSIKSHIQTSLQQFIVVLATLIQHPYPNLDIELYNLFFYYAILALDSPSPLTRTNGLKILSEVTKWNYRPVLEKVEKIKKLMKDGWWEVRAQGLCICANMLMFIAEEEVQKDRQVESTKTEQKQIEHQQHVEDEDQALLDQIQSRSRPMTQNLQEYKQILLDIVYDIFIVSASQNVIRIGLIYLAPILTKYPQLCNRYLRILLQIDPKIRETVLMTNPTIGMEVGQVVSGCNSFRYKLTGAPVVWNSVGIAQAMDDYVKEMHLQNFEYEHLEIILACLYLELQPKDGEVWFLIYENIKNLLFLALCEQELCGFASEVLKKFFLFEAIQERVLKNSFKIFLKLLSLIYHPDIQGSCKENLLELFQFLNEMKENFQTYTYDILKQFSEKHKDLFLKSNLVSFMNQLAKEKRKSLLGEDFY